MLLSIQSQSPTRKFGGPEEPRYAKVGQIGTDVYLWTHSLRVDNGDQRNIFSIDMHQVVRMDIESLCAFELQ
ncbi:hypothetical protein PENSUB_1798 [Penicillium subrubescens]|uniref:Uncharacterized protein n=1 Tax=Penicillium subrubescens TaxID=1316194 RepID=A0A1Q5UJE6_9EURO|nr:hypothetical protein PENSUB_1798 [Penicillium subrubescens]